MAFLPRISAHRRHDTKGGSTMRKFLGLGAALALCAALAAGAAQAGSSRHSVVNLNLATYVWQPTTVAATKNIVASWNASHKDIQVQIVAVDPNSVHDKLLTNFVGGTPADIVHDEAADIAGFTRQGYLADLAPLLPASLKNAIPKDIWDTVRYGSKITGVPSLMQTYNVFANMTILKAAGVKAPTIANPWTWQQFRAVAKKLTTGGNYGVCWGLKSPTAAIQTMALNFGGKFFYTEQGNTVFKFGAAEQAIPRTIHDMIYVDKSIDSAAVGLSGSAVLPAFFAGKCAMTVQGNYQAQGMILQGPKGFNWAMLAPLKGSSQNQVANPQTYSIAQQSSHKKEAMQFIAYLLNHQNMAKLAAGDWLIPADPVAGQLAVKSTKHYGSWKVATSSVKFFKPALWVSLNSYPRWKSEVATPSFVQYLGDKISLADLGKQLSDGWNRVK
jgi:multiple sugar transport system substrate-binding protein